jgi:hypothetical protein
VGGGGKGSRRERLTSSPPSVSRLSRKMWEPRRLTTLWASTACYRDSFTFFPLYNVIRGRNIVGQCRVKQGFRILQVNNFQRDRCWTKEISKMTVLTEVVTPFGSSVCDVRKYNPRWHKVSKVTALQHHSRTT